MGACILYITISLSNQFKTCCRAEIFLKTAANGRYLINVQVITLLLTFIVQLYSRTVIVLSVKSACWVCSCFRKSTEL